MITKAVKIGAIVCGASESEKRTCTVSNASDEWKARFSDKVTQIQIRKGQTIFIEDTPVYGVYVLNKGKAKLVSSDRWGNQRIIRLAGDRHILSNLHCQTAMHAYSAIALEDSAVCFFPLPAWQAALEESGELAVEVAMFYASELCMAEQRYKFITLMTVEERVAFALLYVAELFDDGSGQDAHVVRLSRNDLAQIAGTNAQQVSRALASLKEEGLTEGRRREIVIGSLPRLRSRLKAYLPV